MGISKNKKPSIYFTDLFYKKIWNDYKKHLKNPHTVDTYFSLLCDICDFCKTDFLSLTSIQINDYFQALEKKRSAGTTKSNTIAYRRAVLRSIADYISRNFDRYGLPHDFINLFGPVTIKEPELHVNPKQIPTFNELDYLLQVIKQEGDNNLFIAVSFVIRCALTATEICELKKEHFIIDKNNHIGICFLENGIERKIKIPEDMVLLMEQLSKEQTKAEAEDSYIFHNRRGKKLEIRTLQNYVKKYSMLANIPFCTLQGIRNASIGYMLQCGAPSTKVAEYSGTIVRWMRRYESVCLELNEAAVDFTHIKISW